MSYLFFFGLLSSIGATYLWLSIGPFVTEVGAQPEFLGGIGFARQIGFMFGSLLAGKTGDVSAPAPRAARLEVMQSLVVLLGFVFLKDRESVNGLAFQGWTFLRFFASGFSSVVFFKLLTNQNDSLGKSAGVHLLTLQGAFFFGALVTLAAPVALVSSFSIALAIDSGTSLVLCAFILRFWHNSCEKDADSLSSERTFAAKAAPRLFDGLKEYWRGHRLALGLVQGSAFFAFGGFATLGMHLAARQSELSQNLAYSSYNLIYGASIWIAGWAVHRSLDLDTLSLYGSLFTLTLIALGSVIGQDPFHLLALFSLCLAILFPFMLNATNSRILENVPHEKAASMRSAMMVYLSIALASGELLVGVLLKSEENLKFILAGKSFFLGLFFLLLLFQKGSLSSDAFSRIFSFKKGGKDVG
jgi:hypothetical protein